MPGTTTRLDERLRDSYTQQAVEYDDVRYTSAEGEYFIDLEVQSLERWLSDAASLKILDMPAGTGRLTIPLAAMGAEVYGVDITENMLKKAAEKAAARGISNVMFRVANGRELPFEAGTFDVVTSFKFFHLIPNAEKHEFIDEMRRVLKPGGRLIVEFNSPYYGLVLGWYRYNVRKHAGMSQRCMHPTWLKPLLSGFRVTRTMGVKLPFSGFLSRIFGRKTMTALNLLVGRTPGIKWLCYCVVVEAEKTAPAPA